MKKSKVHKQSDECGDMNANKDILKKIHLKRKVGNKYRKKLLKISKNKIWQVYKSLEALNKKLVGGKSDKIITTGSFGELMVCSLLGMDMLSGTTNRGPDAVLLKDSEIKGLKKGRYQIKYRDDDTSDIMFRVDTDENGRLDERYAWDYLLIATHPTKNGNGYSIRPNNFFIIPLEEAVRLSEVLDGLHTSEKKNNYYYSLRINWKSNREGNGNVGSKRECIKKKFRIKVPREKLKFNNVYIVAF